MKYLIPALLLFIALHTSAFSMPADSLGIEIKDGKTFILHAVEGKETLYSLSRRYNVPIYVIVENNPPSEFGLDIGQILRIPFIKTEKMAKREETRILSKGERIHVVMPKETVFSISKMYNVSIDDIKKWNKMNNHVLDIGQQLLIKRQGAEKSVSKELTTKKEGKTHIVNEKETLFSISRQYNITTDDLKTWNDLLNNDISIGQELIVSKDLIVNTEPSVLAEPIALTIVDSVVQDEPQSPEIGSVEVKAIKDNNSNNNQAVFAGNKENSASSTTFEEIAQSGQAEVIEGSGNTRKYLALHRSAKVGTIMRIKNEMNGQEVFVRVAGKLPDTGDNNGILIKISKSAYDRLGAIDPRFRVSIKYIP